VRDSFVQPAHDFHIRSAMAAHSNTTRPQSFSLAGYYLSMPIAMHAVASWVWFGNGPSRTRRLPASSDIVTVQPTFCAAWPRATVWLGRSIVRPSLCVRVCVGSTNFMCTCGRKRPVGPLRFVFVVFPSNILTPRPWSTIESFFMEPRLSLWGVIHVCTDNGLFIQEPILLSRSRFL